MHFHFSNGSQIKNLKLVLILTSSFISVEVLAGFLLNSLVLIADAGHMFIDICGLFLAWFAIKFSQRPPTPQKTYGFYRFEILAALINGIIVSLLSSYIIYEAYRNFFYFEKSLDSISIISIGIFGLIINLIGISLLQKDAKTNLNIEGAYLEVIKDAIGSVGIIITGIIIFFTNFSLIDPIVSVILVLFIIPRIWSLVKKSIHILMEGVPPNISYEKVKKSILEIKGVTGIFDLHIWTISSNLDALTAHVVISDKNKSDLILREIMSLLDKKFNISHSTIQIETYHEAD
ncbi:MAG TPA: cation diffusion facilitator family transporter [Nitrososphaeraceae archaeon]|nr:cation diffusion facilitator family transporter [Nitrososphaeraceae archaeon]